MVLALSPGGASVAMTKGPEPRAVRLGPENKRLRCLYALLEHLPDYQRLGLYCSVLASFRPSLVYSSDFQSFADGQGGKASFPYCPAVFTSCKSVNY